MNIAIAGFGQEGKASYDYWNVDGNELVIADERNAIPDAPAGTKTILGTDAFSKLSAFDLIIRSPSVNPGKLPYDGKVWSATNEFFEKCPAPIIGVTGTKGKGTTSSLITSILRAAGKTVHLVGNIGTPAITELSKITAGDIVVFELSSFQLWDAIRSPHIAVVLAIEPDHLDVHDSFEDYVEAKANIVRFQDESDTVIFNATNDVSVRISQHVLSQKVAYPDESIMAEFGPSLVIPGRHNVENAAAAVAAIQEYVSDTETIKTGLAAFSGLPHRLKFVSEKDDVRYYDDSIATTTGSAIAAIKSFDQPKVLILGGRDKGVTDYNGLIKLCATELVQVLTMGENASLLNELCEEYRVSYIHETGDMTAVVKRASEIALPGSAVILSPAAASFDMFENYAKRGDAFVEAVHQL